MKLYWEATGSAPRSCVRGPLTILESSPVPTTVMNIEWDYSYYQPWSGNEWLVDEMIAMQEEALMVQNENITMQ